MKNARSKKSTVIPIAVMAVVLVLTITVNIVLTVPLATVMDMYFGKGDIVLDQQDGNVNTTYYTSAYSGPDTLLAAAEELAANVEREGIVLLKNDNNALPLADQQHNISLFGRTSVDPIYTGAGSAATESSPVNYREALEADGFSVNDTLYNFYANHPISTTEIKTSMPTGMGPMDVTYKGRGFISAMGAAMFIGDIIAEVPVADYPDSLEDSYAQYGDAAIVIIGRVGGEGCDLPVDMTDHADKPEDQVRHYLELNSNEMDMLEYVKTQKDAGMFKKIVVVCNTANALEMDFLNDPAYGIDAAIWVGCVGDQGTRAVADVLAGLVTPSGRLVDTYVADLTADPSWQNFDGTYYTNVDGSIGGYESGCFNEYEEGIYVGYRYYETAAAEALAGNYPGFDYDSAVVYPFGYGLSYADFTMTFDGTPSYSDNTFTFQVKVTNNSDTFSGKQVVQIYAETPYTSGGIEKSKVVLVAFDKTSLLGPGQSEVLSLTVNRDDLASYDYKINGCYVLDSGNYKFYLSENAHSWASIDTGNTALCYTHNLEQVIFSDTNARTGDLVTAVNQFSEASAVFTDSPVEGRPMNMSRADFAGTFPTAPTDADREAEPEIKAALESVFSEEDDPQLGNGEGSLVYSADPVTSGTNNNLALIDLRGKDYNDESWNVLLDKLDYAAVQNMLANAGFNTKELTEIGKPATLDYDGPMGWSTWVTANGSTASCVGFPAEEILAATWNEDLAYEVGKMVGEQGLYNGFTGWYAPAANTHRSAFGGRNYEYYSEDGFLGGKMAKQEISGAMELGVYSYTKHFALNDKENGRNGMAVWANEQAIREIYLRPYEIAVKEAEATLTYNDADGNPTTRQIKAATAMMSAYNRIGTTWTGASYGLMTQVLRNEWGFQGTVVTDYFGGNAYMDTDQGIRAGNDAVLNTFADGSLTDKTSNTSLTAQRKAAHNVLYTVTNSNAMQGIATGVGIRYNMAAWQKILITADVVVALILVAGAVTLLRKTKGNNAQSG